MRESAELQNTAEGYQTALVWLSERETTETRERGRERGRETDKEREREREREGERKMEKDRYKEGDR